MKKKPSQPVATSDAQLTRPYQGIVPTVAIWSLLLVVATALTVTLAMRWSYHQERQVSAQQLAVLHGNLWNQLEEDWYTQARLLVSQTVLSPDVLDHFQAYDRIALTEQLSTRFNYSAIEKNLTDWKLIDQQGRQFLSLRDPNQARSDQVTMLDDKPITQYNSTGMMRCKCSALMLVAPILTSDATPLGWMLLHADLPALTKRYRNYVDRPVMVVTESKKRIWAKQADQAILDLLDSTLAQTLIPYQRHQGQLYQIYPTALPSGLKIVVGYDVTQSATTILAHQRLAGLTTLGIFSFIFILGLIILARLLKPLGLLAKAMNIDQAQANKMTAVPVRGSSEVKTLARAFNAMNQKLSDQFASLNDANDDLVKQVAVRRQAQEALQASEEHTRAIVAATADAIITISQKGIIETFNQAAEKMFGYAAEQIIGQNVSLLTSPQHQEKHDGYLRRFLETRENSILDMQRQLVASRQDGSTFPIMLKVTQMKMGEQSGFVGLIRDITEDQKHEAQRKDINSKLLEASRLAGMAEVATGVLHNVGNVLNSVNISAAQAIKVIQRLRIDDLDKVVKLVHEHENDLGRFVTEDKRGKLLPQFLEKFKVHLDKDCKISLDELQLLTENIDHVIQIVAMQQTQSKSLAIAEHFDMLDVINDAVRINRTGLERHRVQLDIQCQQDLPQINTSKHQVLQILINLISNAKYALAYATENEKFLIVKLQHHGQNQICVQVIDNGAGISEENLKSIFMHGFTTKKSGHGFGLHSGVLAAKELGGTLAVDSPGEGQGATFTLTLPFNPPEKTLIESTPPQQAA